MDGVIRSEGVFLYRPPEIDCPWLVVILQGGEVRMAVAVYSETEARARFIEETKLFIESSGTDDID